MATNGQWCFREAFSGMLAWTDPDSDPEQRLGLQVRDQEPHSGCRGMRGRKPWT